MDPTARFTELVALPSRVVPLAEAALWIAAHDHPVDVAANLATIDALATVEPDPDRIATQLFTTSGFAGNVVDYGDPANSYLDAVLERRLGIPITLGLLMIEVGRRLGVPIDGVGMPGHFLVRDAAGMFYDPFHGGARLDATGCRALFESLHGPAPFSARLLEPVDDRAILARILANLIRSFMERRPRSALWAVRLRLAIPGLSVAERRADAAALGTLGSFAEASDALESLAAEVDDATAEALTRDAAALRARAN